VRIKFLYPGCRVRIIYSPNFPDLPGTEGTIVDRGPYPNSSGNPCWRVSCDAWGGKEWCPYKVAWFGPTDDQLEPIIPDGLLEEIKEKELETA